MKKQANKPKQEKPERRADGTLLPGNTANPDGRPPLPEEVRAKLTQRFLAGNEKALNRLEKLIDSPDENIALKASLGWLAKTIKDGLVIELVGKDGEPVKVNADVKVTDDHDPRAALRVIRLLVTAGALPSGLVPVGEVVDAEADEVRKPAPD